MAVIRPLPASYLDWLTPSLQFVTSLVENVNSDSGSKNRPDIQPKEIISYVEALTQLDKVMAYLEHQMETTSAELMVMKWLHNHVSHKHHTKIA